MTGPTPSGSATEIGADPIELTRLATIYLRESQRLAQGLRGATRWRPPSADFGRTAGGAALHQASESAVEQAELAVGRIVEVLEGDVDRLYRLAFSYEEANRRADVTRPGRKAPLP